MGIVRNARLEILAELKNSDGSISLDRILEIYPEYQDGEMGSAAIRMAYQTNLYGMSLSEFKYAVSEESSNRIVAGLNLMLLPLAREGTYWKGNPPPDHRNLDPDGSRLDRLEYESIYGAKQGPGALPGYLPVQGIDGGTGKSNISAEMEAKILEGQRVGNTNKIKGGHSPNAVNNNNPTFAVEEITENTDGTKVVKYYKQYPDGNVSRLKTSTLFPDSWSDEQIIDRIQNIADSQPIGIRPSDGQTLHRGVINGVEIDVIKQGNDVISGYPVGGKPTPGFDPIN